jgi:hypothetical protein
VLQVMPVSRTGLFRANGARSRVLAVCSGVAGALVLLGHLDAVSGASATVSGMVKYSGPTAIGAPTNYAAEPGGLEFKYRITVANPGTDFEKNYFNCIPLPPGLTINTNPGAAGYITGTPTEVGSYPVTLLAGNLNYATPATLPATIVIYPAHTSPVITKQPSSLGVVAEGTATMAVDAFGSLPFRYQWRYRGTNLPNRATAVLTLSSVTSAQAGDYDVVVTNTFGSVTSAVARLTVRELFPFDLRLSDASVAEGVFQFTAVGPIYTNYVVWGSSDLREWTPLRTNFVPDGYLRFSDPGWSAGSRQFYRVSFGP